MPTLALSSCLVDVRETYPIAIPEPDFQGAYVQSFGQQIHLRFVCKGHLGDAETSHGPGHGIVGIGEQRFSIEIGNLVRPGGMNRSARDYGQPIRSISPGVPDNSDVSGDKPAVSGGATLVINL